MVVNGWALPISYVKLCQEIRAGKAQDSWLLKGHVDAYGNRLSNSDLELLSDLEMIKEETEYLHQAFEEDRFHSDPRDVAEPGFVEVQGVDKLVWFGKTASGEPLCFDFRDGSKEPSIITWDGNWQRVAPSFQTFIDLFIPWSEEVWEDWLNR